MDNDKKYRCEGCVNGPCEMTIHDNVMEPHVCLFFSRGMRAEYVLVNGEESLSVDALGQIEDLMDN